IKFALATVLASFLVDGISAEGIRCIAVGNVNCENPNLPKVCGSNGVTYENICYFNLANCDNKGMTVLHNGMCRRDEGRHLRDAQA
ncbi:hypothetical protein PHYSODRAFT_526934, partial [Phytophthora sojae]